MALVAEGRSLCRAARQLHEGARQSQTTFGSFVQELRDPVPRMMLLEDTGGGGRGRGGAGTGASVLTGSEVFDALASIAVGVSSRPP